jgi:hypothetical protein
MRGEKGDPKGNKPDDSPAADSSIEKGEKGDTKLRDATADERQAWGRINDRDVARSLKELWDKIPPSYRLMVTQYFRDITEPEKGNEKGPETSSPGK